MLYVVLALVVLALLAAVARRAYNKGDRGGVIIGEGDCGSCTPGKTRCSRECSMETMLGTAGSIGIGPCDSALYFDDEELDAFRGRPSDSYTEEEAEQFAEVMLTMLPGEVAEWGRCLALRGIALPDRIKDEYIILVES